MTFEEKYFGGDRFPARISELERRAEEAQRELLRMVKSLSPEPWRSVGAFGQPAWQNGWSNYGSGFQVVQFRKAGGDMIQIRGLAVIGSSNTIFTLPTGYRPTSRQLRVTDGGVMFGRVDVHTTGEVIMVYGAAAGAYFSVETDFSLST